MELDELTKTQIILLVLLVSFVTSIATGIVTVSLLAQAPPAVTQTVNHVIERTVQAVVPNNQGASATTGIKETTVVVKEDDLVTKSIADAFTRVGAVHADSASTSAVVALGAVIAPGVVATDLGAASDGVITYAVDVGGTTNLFKATKMYPDLGIMLLTAAPTSTPDAFKIVDAGSLKLGQSVVALYGAARDHIGMSTVGSTAGHRLDTTLGNALTPGAPLISIFGDLLGISTGVARADGRGMFIPASDIVALMNAPAATTSASAK